MFTLASVLALASATAYSTDVIFTKKALDNMPMYVFLAIICCIYFALFVVLCLWKGSAIKAYVVDSANRKYILLAIMGALVGTITADVLMWSALRHTAKQNLPFTSVLVHL